MWTAPARGKLGVAASIVMRDLGPEWIIDARLDLSRISLTLYSMPDE
jgi:hypothetical protein